MGAILLLYPEPAGREDWQQVLNAAGKLAQIAIDHRRFCDELEFQAHHDSLTGLPNRSLLDDRLERAITRARSKGNRLALLYVDIDGFKKINDRFGHRAGDALLTEFGSARATRSPGLAATSSTCFYRKSTGERRLRRLRPNWWRPQDNRS